MLENETLNTHYTINRSIYNINMVITNALIHIFFKNVRLFCLVGCFVVGGGGVLLLIKSCFSVLFLLFLAI